MSLRTVIAVLCGVAVSLFGWYADDYIPGAQPGIGPIQVAIIATGVVVTLIGILLPLDKVPRAVWCALPGGVLMAAGFVWTSGQVWLVALGLVVGLTGVRWSQRPPSRTTAKWLLAGFTTLMMVLSLEVAAFLVLKGTGRDTHPLVFNFASDPQVVPEARRFSAWAPDAPDRVVSLIDPHLGYAHDFGEDDTPGFFTYDDCPSNDDCHIVALGGSTTDAAFIEENWPRHLVDIMAEHESECCVLNGGVLGYSSSQELLKLIRDVLPLNPQVIISLNGINDLGGMGHAVDGYPMVNSYQRSLFDQIASGNRPDPKLFPNLLSVLKPAGGTIQGVSLGTRSELQGVDLWKRNVTLMHAAAASCKINYICFLQPTMGIGGYVESPEDIEMFGRFDDSYRTKLQQFYSAARTFAATAPYIVDISDVFSGQTGLFADPRHPNGQGNRIIAESIHRELVNRKWLSLPDGLPGETLQ